MAMTQDINVPNECGACNFNGNTGRPVPGDGPLDARIMLIGQNPGAEEVKAGKPFVGNSGKYLNRILSQNGIKREDIYITNVVKCKTPENRKPTALEIKHCIPFLIEEIKRVSPKVIVLMGEVAQKTPRMEGIQYIETYHPMAALRFPKMREKFKEDFARLREYA